MFATLAGFMMLFASGIFGGGTVHCGHAVNLCATDNIYQMSPSTFETAWGGTTPYAVPGCAKFVEPGVTVCA